eukprot:COSAG02_NODE_1610_length_11681_cov_11.455103_12_plen_277_part_00
MMKAAALFLFATAAVVKAQDGCAGVDPVCAESDMGITQGLQFEDMTQGCQCCFMNNADADPMAACIAPLFPQVDFCVDPGNAQNNPDGAIYECRHSCETGTWEEQNAAGCHGDNSGNQHQDQVCVTEGVYEPGEMQPWGETCCDWCGDQDGDGNPDYQGCCEGNRADGEMGCEDQQCVWMCNGVDCFDHGADQATCEGNGGTWTLDNSCATLIATQGLIVQELASQGFSADIATMFWLGEFAETCCTGYQPPNYEGSCDNDQDLYVSVACSCLVFC